MAVTDEVREDLDALETSEWVEAIDSVLAHDGPERARHILTRVLERAQHAGTGAIATLHTPYVNTISPEREAPLPGGVRGAEVERRLRSIVRWNAMAMVVRAKKASSELGGHIASFQSLATLYEVGFNHSGTPRQTTTAATSSTSRATPPRATTRARFWKGG